MPLYDRCPHLCDVYTSSSSTDQGGGNATVFTLAQSAVPCWAPLNGSSEQERFGQQQIAVSRSVFFKASSLTSPLARGNKLVVNGSSLHVEGIKAHQAAGKVPALVEASCTELL